MSWQHHLSAAMGFLQVLLAGVYTLLNDRKTEYCALSKISSDPLLDFLIGCKVCIRSVTERESQLKLIESVPVTWFVSDCKRESKLQKEKKTRTLLPRTTVRKTSCVK